MDNLLSGQFAEMNVYHVSLGFCRVEEFDGLLFGLVERVSVDICFLAVEKCFVSVHNKCDDVVLTYII